MSVCAPRMIEGKEIAAKIDHSQGLVSFEDDLSEVDLAVMAQKIEKQLKESMHLAEKVKSLSNEVSQVVKSHLYSII